VTVAFYAQGRFHEAATFMIAGVEHILSARILLPKACFSLDFPTRDFSLEVLETCLLAAVTGDSWSPTKELTEKDVQLKEEIKSYSVGILAARHGNQRMLKFLLDEGIDVLSPSRSNYLLGYPLNLIELTPYNFC
jgi:hypothetical protein